MASLSFIIIKKLSKKELNKVKIHHIAPSENPKYRGKEEISIIFPLKGMLSVQDIP